MKKIFSIVALVTLGALTGCTTNTPVVDESKTKVETEVKKEATSQVSEVVQDKVVSVAKTVAIGAATKKVKELAAKK